MLNGKPLPTPPGGAAPPGYRYLVTGTGVDAAGKPIASFGLVKVGAQTDPLSYAAKDTQVWSFADPNHPVKIGTLPNISQASVTYNSAEGRWVVIGNAATADASGKVTGLGSRTIWTATDSAGNNTWMNSIGHGGSTVPDGGTRENQYYPLKGGGSMLLDTANDLGVRAYVAPTTQGLTAPGIETHTIGDHFQQSAAPPLPAGAARWQYSPPYGPTVVNDVINADGTETVTVRVSDWLTAMQADGTALPGPNYYPHTYTYQVDIQR